MANGSLLMDYAAGGWIEDIEVRNPGQHSHGIDGPLMDDFPSYKPPFMVGIFHIFHGKLLVITR